MTSRAIGAVLSVAGALLLAAACSGSREPAAAGAAARQPGGSGSAEIVYRPGVLVVERDEGLRALAAVSRDGSTLVFESSDSKWQSLKAGDTLVIKGVLAKKILGVDVEGSRVGILTQPASLVEIAEQARIHLDAPIRFAAAQAQNLESPFQSPWTLLSRLALPIVHAQAPDAERAHKAEADGRSDAAKSLAMGAVSGIFKGWETHYSAKPLDGRLNLSLQMTKKVAGFVAQIEGEGYLADFALASDIVVERSALERLEVTYKKLNGVMNFKWAISKDTPGPLNLDDRIKLPAAISIPLYQYLGGFPLYLEISSAIIIKPAITGGKEYSRGAFRITFDAHNGFKAREGNIDPNGEVTGDIEFVRTQAITAAAPLGLVLAMAAPRLELTTGVSKIASFEDFKDAAEKAEMVAERVITRVFGAEAYDRYKNSPAGQFTPSKAVEAAMGSDAAAYIELVTSSGMSASGMSAFSPCTRTDLRFLVRVGASGQAFGMQAPKISEDVFMKTVSRVEPPGIKLCENIGGESTSEGAGQ
jgi:hypothetical protein